MPDKDNEVELIVLEQSVTPESEQSTVKSLDEVTQANSKCDKEVQVSVPMVADYLQIIDTSADDNSEEKEAFIEEVHLFLRNESKSAAADIRTEPIAREDPILLQPDAETGSEKRRSFIQEMHVFLNNDNAINDELDIEIGQLRSDETWLFTTSPTDKTDDIELDDDYPAEFDPFNQEIQNLNEQDSEVTSNGDKSENDKEVAILMAKEEINRDLATLLAEDSEPEAEIESVSPYVILIKYKLPYYLPRCKQNRN
ncbi:hypothetical protein Trydic_g4906 [Trypoxylus dichotomus]